MISASVLLHQDGDFYTPLALTVTFQLEQSGHLFRGQKEQEFGSASTLL